MMLLGICLKVPSIRQLVMNMKLSTKEKQRLKPIRISVNIHFFIINDLYEANNQTLTSMTKLYFRTVFSGSDFLYV